MRYEWEAALENEKGRLMGGLLRARPGIPSPRLIMCTGYWIHEAMAMLEAREAFDDRLLDGVLLRRGQQVGDANHAGSNHGV